MRQRWKQAGKETRHGPRPGIKLCAAPQHAVKATRKADGEKTGEFVRCKTPDVSRVGFHLRRLHPKEKGQAIMQRADIGHPKNDVPAKTELQGHLVTDPEEFFHVFKHLVCDRKINAGVVEREDRAFEIANPELDPALLQEVPICFKAVNAEQACVWKMPPDQTQVVPLAHTEVTCELHQRELREHLFDGMPRCLLDS